MSDDAGRVSSYSLGRTLHRESGRALGAWRFWLGLAISGGAAYLALQGIDIQQVRRALDDIRPAWAVLGLALVVVTMAVKAARWRALYPQGEGRPSLSALIPALLAGTMVNLLIPARLGELARVYALEDLEGESKVLSLGTIAVEKWADLLLLLVTFAGLLLFVAWPAWLGMWARRLLWGAVGLTVILTFSAACVGRAEPLVQRGAAHLPAGWGAALVRGWQALHQGLAPLRSVPRLGSLLGWTILIWALSAATNWVVLRAVALPASPVIALTLLVILQAGSALPSSPAKIGVFHYLAVVGLGLFHLPREEALAFAIWLHLIVVGWLIALGVGSVLWISLRGRASALPPG